MRILILGDIHLPFCNWQAIEAASQFAKTYKPDLIIQLGDFIDSYNWSLYKKALDAPSAEAEWNEVELAVDKFHKLFSRWPMTILEGNHCRRHMLRAFEANIPRKLIRLLPDVFPFENWQWHMQPQPLIVDNIAFVHGDEVPTPVRQKSLAYGRSVVQGHTHQASLHYINIFGHQTFAMEAGCLIDQESIAARYAAKNPNRCFIGVATITDGIPALRPIR